MTATMVNVQEAKTKLSELLKRVEEGEEIVIARAGTPIAELRPIVQPTFVYGGFRVTLGADFNEPLTEAETAMWADGGADDPLPR